jgi:hypothetical protein
LRWNMASLEKCGLNIGRAPVAVRIEIGSNREVS